MKKLYTLLFPLLLGMACYAQAPTANFTAAQTSGCAPIIIHFQDLSTGTPTSWQWDFGNGNTSTLQNPSTTYFTPGTYTVTLTATNTSGSNRLSRTGFITIYGKPMVSFTANDSTGCAPFNVQFTELSTPSAGTSNISWQWDFGNGTGSTAQNPSTSFAATGNYNISLKVTNDKGCFASLSKTSYIQISGGLSIDFSSSNSGRCRAPFPVNFTNNSTGPGALTYYWNFGDGNTSTLQNPSNIYSTSGNYNVSLAVTSSNGCTDTLRRTNFISIENINTAFTSPDSICILSPANFINTSSPAAQSSFWDFGDGTTSTATSPLKAFTVPGSYTVRLLQTYSYCSDSFSRSIKILPRPTAQFSANNTIQCKPPLTVNFTDASANAVSWKWNFGDGGTSNQQSPTHTYTAFGNFDVTLIVTNSSGCSDTIIQPAYIKIQKPVISFPGFPQKGCIPYATTFTAGISTLDNVTSYLWDFGDGNSSTLATPSHTYPAQGNYSVTLTITTSTGCTEVYTMNNAIVVGRIPVIDFTATPNPVCAFGTVQYNGIANEGDTWLWDLGDGSTSTQQNPLHQYADSGNYNVSLTVTNNGCPQTVTKTSFIRVNPPISNFSFQNDCSNRKQFFFTDQSKGATSWLWDFGDGNTSNQQNPTHTFSTFGTYTVSLTVMNDTCSHTKTIQLNVFDETPSFVANKVVACKTATIDYSVLINNVSNIVAYQWDFSNGSTSASQNPYTIYTASGSYTTTLVTTDKYGCLDTATKTNYIRINGPTANFSASNTNGCVGLVAQFNDQSQYDGVNQLVSWKWNYGDGTSQTFTTSTSPQHTYNAAGSYTVQLILTDASGCTDSISFPALVNTTRPTATFSSADTLTCLGSGVQFSNSSSATGATYFWDFGDGNTSTLLNPSHVYADTGTYTIQLALTDQYGCSDTIQRPNYITIKETIAAFQVSDSLGGCTPFEVQFTNNSQFYTSSTWQLGNGTSSVNNPTQVYNTAGTYLIQLVVTGRGGCADTTTKTIQIFDASASTFSYDPIAGCKPLQLNASVSSPAGMTYSWDFGDGTIINTTDSNLTYTYTLFGNYVPKLILTDSGNCLLPLIGMDTVRIIGVTAAFGWDKKLFCDSGTIQFFDSTIANDRITSYSWNFGDGGTSSIPSPAHHYNSPGLYTVSLALETEGACTDTLRFDQLVKVVASPSIHIDADTVICKDGFVDYTGVFNLVDTSAVQWQWQFPTGNSTQQTPPRQQFMTAGNFTIQAIATNSSGCADTAAKTLLVNPLPQINIPTPQITPLGTPVVLPATYSANVTSYTWSPAMGLSCTDCAQPLASPKFNTVYSVEVVDSNSCRNKAQVLVIVLCQGSLVFLPNTFSPNGDGSNDVFYVRGKGLSRVKSLRIFNRWGEPVFEKINFGVNDPSTGWDGTYKGKKLSPDVYVYQVDVFCDNSESIRFEGNISLIH